MKLFLIERLNITESRSFILPEELSDHTIISMGALSGLPVLSLWTEEEWDMLPVNSILRKPVLGSAMQIIDRCCEISEFLAEYAEITDFYEILQDTKGRCFICSDKHICSLLD